jgi:hypothetical protein
MTMTCGRKNIQELLPAYLAGSLVDEERSRVEEHLAACRDCAAELDLLRMLSPEAVPDPGDAFWGSFADRLYHDVQRHRRRQWSSRLADLFRGALIPRWAWAATATAALIVATWLVVRPVPHRAPVSAAKHRPVPAVDIIQEASNSNEVRQEDLERLSVWARQELLSLRNGLTDLPGGGNGAGGESALNVDIEDELASLSEEQLEVLIDSLNDDAPNDAMDEEA